MRVSEPINSGPCRHCYGDHPDERCWLRNHDRLNPVDAAALEMWGRKQFIKCRERLSELEKENYGDWEAYNLMCVDCESHDECFDTPEWFDYLMDRKDE